MTWRTDFENGLRKYMRLNVMWVTATVLLLGAYLATIDSTLSFTLAAVLFFLGAINLGAAGVSCAYVIARDNA